MPATQLDLWPPTSLTPSPPVPSAVAPAAKSLPRSDQPASHAISEEVAPALESLFDPPAPSKKKRLTQLRQQLRQLETENRPEESAISTGCEALDHLLPATGLQPGTITEWIGTTGSSAGWLALLAAASAVRQRGGRVVVLDVDGDLYLPTFFAAGLPPEQIVIVRPPNLADAMWTIDQALRCSAIAAVWASIGKVDGRQQRRLQLAAETGGGLGLFVRPPFCLPEPSWAEVRLHVTPQAICTPPASGEGPAATRLLHVRIARCRGGRSGMMLPMELDESTGQIRSIPSETKPASPPPSRLAPAATTHKIEALKQRLAREPNNAASTLHLATELAHPTAPRRKRRTA